MIKLRNLDLRGVTSDFHFDKIEEKIIFSDLSWEDNSNNNVCPVCRKSPVQILFNTTYNNFSLGRCMLPSCGSLIAYTKINRSNKRSRWRKKHGGNMNEISKLEKLRFEEIKKDLITELEDKKPKEWKQMCFEFE